MLRNALSAVRVAPVTGAACASAMVYARLASLPHRLVNTVAKDDLRRFNQMASEATVTFEEVKKLTQNPREDVLLVDVRNPDEHAMGQIPNSQLIPLHELPSALALSPDDFEETFGFKKPSPDTRLVFFCRSGARSSGAVELARAAGYTNVQNYLGSWLDWEARHNQELHRAPHTLD